MELTEFAIKTLEDRYLRPEDQNVEDAFTRAAKAFSDSEEMFVILNEYIKKQWLIPSTPVLSNAPVRKEWVDGSVEDQFRPERFTGKKIGLPISCFLNYVPDSRKGLGDHYNENIWLASAGGGIGGYWGDIRSDGATTSNGSVSTGSIPFLHVVDSQMLAFNQGRTRRGSYAAYMDINHPEIVEFLQIRKPTGGDVNRKCLNLHNAVNITDVFMQQLEAVLAGDLDQDNWPLIDPNSKKVTEVVSVLELWTSIMQLRATTGEPYIHYVDTSNRWLPDPLKELGLEVNHSNLCSEITLATSEDRTAVCCLSSTNLEKYDEWKDEENFIYYCLRFLDNVLEYFIQAAQNVPKAVNSAKRERSLGLGSLGWHSYLQAHNVPFESAMAESYNRTIYSKMQQDGISATKQLARERGCPEDLRWWGRRNAHLFAIAPNASTSIIANTSPSIEPWKSNAFTHRTMSGAYFVKNKHLEKLLEEKGMNTKEVWQDITVNNGSVQHLSFLSDWEKDVFKTAVEIDQQWVIHHAATRQPHICQAQSVNIFIPEELDIKIFSGWHYKAWKEGLKTLYYCRSVPTRRAEDLTKKVERIYLEDTECLSCEG